VAEAFFVTSSTFPVRPRNMLRNWDFAIVIDRCSVHWILEFSNIFKLFLCVILMYICTKFVIQNSFNSVMITKGYWHSSILKCIESNHVNFEITFKR
jgi:hypothetical protein